MKNYFSGKIKSAKSNEHGLSLVELVVAVAILAAVSTVLLHSFVTSNNVTNKAMKIGEATDAAQNIQEAIETLGTGMFLSSDNALTENKTTNEVSKLLTVIKGGTEYVPTYESVVDYAKSSEEDNNKTEKVVNLSGIKSGTSTFDAVVTFKSGVNVDGSRDSRTEIPVDYGFYAINSKDVANYSTPDGNFVQPYRISENPDIRVESSIRDNKDFSKITYKKRTIKIDITGTKNDTDGSFSNIQVITKWDYNIKYTTKTGGNSEDSHTSDSVYATNYNQTDFVNEVVIDNGTWKPGDDYLTAFIMYYPSYSDESVRGCNETFNDYVEINNLSDCPVKIILIKQKPMIYVSELDRYFSLVEAVQNAEETPDYNDSALTEEIKKAHFIKNGLTGYDNLYNIEINEYRSQNYVADFEKETTQGTFFSNAGINLGYLYSGTSEIKPIGGRIAYTIKASIDGLTNTGVQRTLTELVADGSVVEKGKFDRLYDVTIELKQSGSDETYATFKSSILK